MTLMIVVDAVGVMTMTAGLLPVAGEMTMTTTSTLMMIAVERRRHQLAGQASVAPSRTGPLRHQPLARRLRLLLAQEERRHRLQHERPPHHLRPQERRLRLQQGQPPRHLPPGRRHLLQGQPRRLRHDHLQQGQHHLRQQELQPLPEAALRHRLFEERRQLSPPLTMMTMSRMSSGILPLL